MAIRIDGRTPRNWTVGAMIKKKSISIIGGGPAALMLAAWLNNEQFNVSIYEQNKSLGRKFLVAGKGGFNLTHAEPIAQLIQRYTPPSFLQQALRNFDNNDLQNWLKEIGIPTFVGTSKRVYPVKGIKPIEVLNAIVKVLSNRGVKIQYEHTWKGWNNNNLVFNNDTEIASDITVFALGGGSWKVTGSDGTWLDLFHNHNINVVPFQASNCAYKVNWPAPFIAKHEGNPLKNISASCGNKTQKGELVITQFGLEGNAIYALSPQIREALNAKQQAIVFLDIKPALTAEEVLLKIKKSTLKNTTDILRTALNLSPAQIGLLKTYTTKETFLNLELLTASIKQLPIEVTASAPIDQAISTTGGLSLDEVDEWFQLKKRPQQYCIGEMLDWDAPTGGYLLQACFSIGVHLAHHLNNTH
ncbi:NAD(P)/FAD-dependent oxidoreductase [Bacteroidota bacterium]